MAATPKAVRRNGGSCVCADSGTRALRDRDYAEDTCHPGYCFIARCQRCGGEIYSAGPLACPCKKKDHPRWIRYPGMETPGHWDLEKDEFIRVHAAVKPSVLRRRSH